MKKVLQQFTLLLLLLPSFVSLAQPDIDAQMQRLETALAAVRQEQHSVYQQFQMIQALRQSELQNAVTMPSPAYAPAGEPPNYDDMVRAQQESQNRLRDYSDELQRLYARYRDLEVQSRQLVDQMNGLARGQ
ncbi:MAG TPA: hypothetical protein VFB20_00195 [Burkholderiales bacterium]|nr:hypothetical protein [Burkholderiales bacterium]